MKPRMTLAEIRAEAKRAGCTLTELCKRAGVKRLQFYRHLNRPELISIGEYDSLVEALHAVKRKGKKP